MESLAPKTANREDLSLLKLHAWCVDPDEVPVVKRLWVPEAEEVDPAACMPTSRQLLEYMTLIHVGRIREHEGLERWLCPTNSDGSGQSGLPEDSGGFFGRGEWNVLPWTRGVRGHHGGMHPSEAQGGSYRQALLGCIGPSNWRIPPMVNATEAMECTRTVAIPRTKTALPTCQTVVTAAPRLAPTELATRRATDKVGSAHQATEDLSVERQGAVEVGHTAQADPLPRSSSFDHGHVMVQDMQPMSTKQVLSWGLPSMGMDKVVLDPPSRDNEVDPMEKGKWQVDASEVGPSDPSDGANPVTAIEVGLQKTLELATANDVGPQQMLEMATTTLTDPEEGPSASHVVATTRATKLCVGSYSAGWAPLLDLVPTRAPEDVGERPLDVVGPGLNTAQAREPMGPVAEVTTYDCMSPSWSNTTGPVGQDQGDGLTSKEQIALQNIKSFCTGLLKNLAPPLLREFEGLRGIKAGQDPFTPRHATRSVSLGGNRKSKASAAEAVLLKALRFDSDDMAVSEDALGQLRTVFDSPL
ncbi:hypothetical protein D1007_21404 [Hordeum vulgare]|nr:hypothetical protein D1007_21404 [Hordeum vulgare]